MKRVCKIISLSFIVASCFALTTNQMAEKLHFPRFIDDLGDKVQDFLKAKEITMKIDVQNLRRSNLMNEGDYFENADADLYDTIDERFENEFIRLDEKYDAVSQRLDDEDAPDSVKANFIKALQAESSASISALMEHYRGT